MIKEIIKIKNITQVKIKIIESTKNPIINTSKKTMIKDTRNEDILPVIQGLNQVNLLGDTPDQDLNLIQEIEKEDLIKIVIGIKTTIGVEKMII
jgi:hypothetical protein